jgi:CheY-like chemotaxis protein
VDDSDIDRTVFEGYLAAEGIITATAGDAETAIRLIEEGVQTGELFQVVLIDDHLVATTGMALARKVLDRFGSRSPPMVLVSSGDTPPKSDLDRALFQAILERPLRGAELIACLRRLPDLGSAPGGSGVKVLFVDDNEINRLLGVTLLENAGFAVESAADGVEAVEAVKRGDFAVVFMDVKMPKMDGVAATRAIRNTLLFNKNRVPIIAVTANAMVGDREVYLRAGMNDYLSKPLDPRELQAMAKRWTLSAKPPQEAPEAMLSPPPKDFEAIPLVDQSAVDRLRGVIPAPKFQAIIQTYVGTDFLSRIEKEAAAQDFEALDLAAHTCKGTSANVGASRLAEVAHELEMACRIKDAPGIARLLPEMRRVSDLTKSALARSAFN